MGSVALGDLRVEGWVKASLVDYPGGLCSTVFLAGCNMRCPYCHNPEMAQSSASLPRHAWTGVQRHLSSRIGLLDAVCFSGGEPTLRKDLPFMLESVKGLGFKAKLDTNGTRPDVLRFLVEDGLVDYVAMDVKSPLRKYEAACGVTVDVGAIEESARTVMESGVPYEFRTTAHPGLLDLGDFEEIGRWLCGAGRYVIQRCRVGVNLDPSFRRLEAPAIEWLRNAAGQCAPFFESVELRG